MGSMVWKNSFYIIKKQHMKHIIKYPEMDYIINCEWCWCIFECDRKEIKMVDYKEYWWNETKISEWTQCPLCHEWRNLNWEKIYNVEWTHKR